MRSERYAEVRIGSSWAHVRHTQETTEPATLTQLGEKAKILKLLKTTQTALSDCMKTMQAFATNLFSVEQNI